MGKQFKKRKWVILLNYMFASLIDNNKPMGIISEGINELEQIDLQKEDAISKIKTVFLEKFKKLPSFRCDLALNTFIIRARHLDGKTENYYNIQDCSYNPKIDQITLGRANYPKQQIFYGSTTRITSLTEIRFVHNLLEQETSKFVISKWKILSPLQLAVIVDPDFAKQNNAAGLIGISDFIRKMEKDFRNNEEIKDFLELYKYMSKKFTEPVKPYQEYKYKITAAFSNFIYDQLEGCDGIIYQSVQNPTDFNIALKRDAIVAQKVKLESAYLQKIKKEEGFNFKETESISSINIDYHSGKIEW